MTVDPHRAPELNEEERERRAAEQEAQKYDPHAGWDWNGSRWVHLGREGWYDGEAA